MLRLTDGATLENPDAVAAVVAMLGSSDAYFRHGHRGAYRRRNAHVAD
jgi:hypothetical protein